MENGLNVRKSYSTRDDDHRGASQMVHSSTAVGFDNIQVEQVQVAPELPVSTGFIPAADQSKALAEAGIADGRGASQIVHFSKAMSALVSIQVEQVHSASEVSALLGFTPAAAQSNPFTGVIGGFTTLSGFGTGGVKSKEGSEDVGRVFASVRALS